MSGEWKILRCLAKKANSVVKNYTPDVVQVIPHEDYTVSVYFCDGKIVIYDVRPKLEKGVFQQLKDLNVFMNQCTIMNHTLAWDIDGHNDPTTCIDIDPEMLYGLAYAEERMIG